LHQVSYRFDDFEALGLALDAEDTDLAIEDENAQHAKDGQWLLVSFIVGEESTSVAGRVVDRGDALRLTFEERDRLRLRNFATGNARPSVRSLQLAEQQLMPPSSRALVVSASAPVASIVGQLIQGWGASVETVGSVEDALDVLRQQSIDVIVLDSLLPGLDCSDLCQALSRSQNGSRPSVLLLGQDPTCSDAHAAIAAGADDFVQKPFRAQELRARLVGLLEHKLCG
jgi:two-component system, OmpR family, phosphate regulon response regulator PhoB